MIRRPGVEHRDRRKRVKRSAEHPGDSPASTNGWPTTPDGIGADLAAYDEIAARDTFRLVTDTIPHLIWTASPDGDIDYCNQCWEDYTGMPAGRAKRLSLAGRPPPGRSRPVYRTLACGDRRRKRF
jgi:PAS domain-containing protein